MLILGLLAAIAVPSFFNQRSKATDAKAKVYARTAETAMETFATDNGGSYAAATPAALVAIEPTLAGATNLTTSGLTGNAYTVSVTSTSVPAVTFSITRIGTGANTGQTTLDCLPLGTGGCPASGHWG